MAGGGALAAGDFRALEGRPGRQRGGQQSIAVAEDQLGIGADIDDQGNLIGKMGALGQHRCRGVGPTWPAMQGRK